MAAAFPGYILFNVISGSGRVLEVGSLPCSGNGSCSRKGTGVLMISWARINLLTSADGPSAM